MTSTLRLLLIGSCTILIGLSSGCSAIPDGRAESQEFSALIAQKPKPIPGTVAIAPVQINIKDPGDAKFNPQQIPDKELLQGQLGEWLKRSNLFLGTTKLVAEDNQKLDDLAWAEGADFILECTITGLKPRFKRRDWSWYANVANWLFWMVPAWYVAGEEYELALRADCRFRLVDQKAPLIRLDIEQTVSGMFDEFDLGWRFLGIPMLLTPALNDGEEATAVSKRLYPAAASAVSQKLAAQVNDEFREVIQSEKYEKSSKRTLALVVGVGSYRNSQSFPNNPNYSKGAKLLAQELTRKHGARYVESLIDAEANNKRFEESVKRHLEKRSREGDNLIIFIAARSMVLSGEPLLVMNDASESGRGALSLARLARLLGPLKGRVALFIETQLPKSLAKRSLANVFAPLLRKRVSVLTAAQPGQRLASTNYGMGLFPFHVSGALSGKADENRDGVLSYDELGRYVTKRVRSDAGFVGEAQTPFTQIVESQSP